VPRPAFNVKRRWRPVPLYLLNSWMALVPAAKEPSPAQSQARRLADWQWFCARTRKERPPLPSTQPPARGSFSFLLGSLQRNRKKAGTTLGPRLSFTMAARSRFAALSTLATLAALTTLGAALLVRQVLVHVHVFVAHAGLLAAVTLTGLAAVLAAFLVHLLVAAALVALSLALVLLALAWLATLLAPLIALPAILLLLAIRLLARTLAGALAGALALVLLIAVLVLCHLSLL
jgi:hypothetical protein